MIGKALEGTWYWNPQFGAFSFVSFRTADLGYLHLQARKLWSAHAYERKLQVPTFFVCTCIGALLWLYVSNMPNRVSFYWVSNTAEFLPWHFPGPRELTGKGTSRLECTCFIYCIFEYNTTLQISYITSPYEAACWGDIHGDVQLS